ncbi:carboxypeptidase-like regulatory domain-containing protein [Paraburkholderia kururiensis]|uniref:Carboxypeptidase-like regulatory domain-containing protein n=1 Tax=Paraburkholderia kururiensis TaxID=984307 RepID=A0ABZ0WH57_9BURK|nr:carboxypeptidase-like regulatory domain-containing protein [Paraburkholderia kururiensis]WQD76694.1 carboxypeptidase-like regulatory domain-containing protein [Paraburkholderia kururiensis]
MNTRRALRSFATVAAAAAFAVVASGGFASHAWAQASDVTGGSTTDNTSAGNTNGGGLPQVQQQGDVSFVSGGVGLDESKALERAQSQWPLALRFTGPTADYLADVHVRIVDSHGGEALSTTSRGPFMLVRVRPGRYTVHASYNGEEKVSAVTVPAKGTARAGFHWNTQ